MRTPVYELQDYHVFSTATGQASKGEAGTMWVGVFGRWYALRVGGEKGDDKERRGRVRSGVKSLEVEDGVQVEEADLEEPTPSPVRPIERPAPVELPSSPSSPTSATPPKLVARPTGPKRTFRSTASQPPTSLAKLRSAAESASPPSPPLKPDPSSLLPPTPPTPVAVVPPPPPPPTDPVLTELQLQLAELELASSQSEARLLDSLDVLRARKKDEDLFRAELKGRTKGLEETKRAAELARSEAEHEIADRRAVVREMEANVARLHAEIGEIARREQDAVEKQKKKARDRKERERKLRDDVQRRKDDLQKAEDGVDNMFAKVRGLEKTIDARREVLYSRRAELHARPAYGGATRAFGRAPGGPYGSRPASIRSFDPHPHSSHEYSPPSSPPTSPADHVPSSAAAVAAFYSSTFAPPAPEGFLSHRLAHRSSPPLTISTHSATLPSVDDIPLNFLPFDFDPSPARSSDDLTRSRPQLSLPLQYLDSGLLATASSDEETALLSPMTPHQASLIPSQLFSMLDDDDDDDFPLPDSPTFASSGRPDEWVGLGLVSAAAEDASSPWGSTDQLLLPRSPPADDDLPRSGLSLNPGAKAFAFQPRHSPLVRQATTPSPTHDPPKSRSRMEFSSSRASAEFAGTGEWAGGATTSFNPFAEDGEGEGAK